jgi:mono/diheme cytochrome c family protein
MGPDHPQYEMWMTSRHGILFNLKGRFLAPDCMTCHMPEGDHNVSTGITMGLAGQEYPEPVREEQRVKMLTACSTCHTKSFSLRNLEDADAVQRQAKAIVDEAASIIRGLEKDGLLKPSPAERPAHPLSGKKLEIGPQMLYEDLSGVEAVFFRMKKFYYVITYKGVFHQNPDFAHWYGNAPLKLALSEIKSEAALLRELKNLKERVDNLSAFGRTGTDSDKQSEADTLRTNLGHLRELYLRGDLSEEEFRKRKNDLLDRHGL